ncbi:MAG: MotA/TolQ/ExbB proton channel family protein [Verrucomicrobiota bacterium]
MHLISRRIRRNALTLCFAFAVMGLTAAVLAQEPAAAPAAEAPHGKTALGMVWEVAKTPPFVFFMLVGCSIFTFTIIPERIMYYRKSAGNTAGLVEKIKAANSFSDALTAIEPDTGVAARVIRSALTAARDGYHPEHVEQLVQGEVTRELIGLEKMLPMLDSMVTMCPLAGLLGTTIGMIRSFSIVSEKGMSDPSALAGGISEALINTATGLAIALPALVAYNYLTGRKEQILMDLEKGLSEVMVLIKQSHEG